MDIPVKPMSGRQLITTLRELIDKVSDSSYRYKNPDGFALDYHLLMHIISTQKKNLYQPSVYHNLGETRMKYIADLLGETYKPSAKRKPKTLQVLKEASRGK